MKKLLVVLIVALATIALFVGCKETPKENPKTKTYKVGDTGPAGGVIFYVADEEQTSTYVDKKGQTVTYKWKYLEAAPSDLTVTEGETETSKFVFGYYYNNGVRSLVNGTSSDIGTGRANTRTLVNAIGSEASTKGTVCSTCNSAGTVSCAECGGDGKISERTCTGCNGRKTVTSNCSECDGEGETFDRNCGGTGCNQCNNTGMLACSACNGSGWVTVSCTTCNGTGKVTLSEEENCSVCTGTGSVECPSCKATRTADYAAKLCDDYSVTKDGKVYDDWFLPSKAELNEIYKNKASISNLVYGENKSYYWSSTEGTNEDSWGHDFYDNDVNYGERSCTFYIRPVRAF